MKELMKWLDRKITNLEIYTSELSAINTTYYDIKEWSVLKLIFLSYFTSIYTKIIPKRVNNCFFIDLFAGSGINRVESTQDFVLGSSMIATCFATEPFTEMFFVEKDKEKIRALKERLDYLSAKEEFTWIKPILCQNDCNEVISPIVDKIQDYGKSGKIHYLAFIDPYGMEISWSSMEKLLEVEYGDIIFTYQTQEIGRTYGNAIRNPSYAEAMRKFFGDEKWREARNREELLQIYKSNVRKHRKVVLDVPIKGRQFMYHLIFATRETRGGNPWLNAVDDCKEYIKNLGGEERMIRASLDYFSGRSSRLEDFSR